MADGYTIVTWNGLGFDFPVLADESGLLDRCIHLAENHIDLHFHTAGFLGFVSLPNTDEGLGLRWKTEGVYDAPISALWAAGRHWEVIDYCIRHVVATLRLSVAGREVKRVSWISANGTQSSIDLPRGWLPVSEARSLAHRTHRG